jgi:prenyltransferase beta subunit
MAWPSNARAPRRTPRSWALGLALGTLLIACMAVPALAAPEDEANATRLDSTVRFLESAQNSDGGFTTNGDAGEASNPDVTAWVSIALAAAGINPQNQSQPDGASAYSYLSEHSRELSETTNFERVLMVVDAAGTSPQDFGGVNLVQAILNRRLPDGGFAHEEGSATPGVNDTIFAIIALSPIREPGLQEAISGAVEWLENDQSSSDGSWPLTPGAPGNVDITAAAIEALNAAGVHNSKAQREAFKYLHGAQDPDGGFYEYATNPESDSASTSWTVQAIWSAGENPETWKQESSGKEPLDYLESLQRANGSIQWKAGSDGEPVWMTAYAAPAFAGQPLPPPFVPLQVASSVPPASGGGVTAGGGGDGAPLFSRPQPQSVGDTPGGARQLHGARRHDRGTTSRHDREPDSRQTADALAIAASGGGEPAASTQRHPHRHREARAAPTSHSAAGNSSRGSGAAVTGLVINASDDTPIAQSGAPGLRSAGTDENATRWFAIALAGLIVALILVGSQLERRRPEAIL